MEKKPKRAKRFERVLEEFQETLLSFCESVLSNGSRSGDEWIVPDLENSPRKNGKLGSCSINLTKGCFYDHNPCAVPREGGMIELWRAIFGGTNAEIIDGMEKWVKEGIFPDGSKGVPNANKLELQGEVVIEAEDDYEREQIKWINVFRQWIDWRSKSADPYVGFIYRSHLRFGWPDGKRVDEVDWEADQRECLLNYENFIAQRVSHIQSHRWLKLVEATAVVREKLAGELAETRGLRPEVFLWLIDNGFIVLNYNEQFECTELAFPVFRVAYWYPEINKPDIQFMGMHIPFFLNGEKRWKYAPKGCGSAPLIIGDPSEASEVIVIGESQWDVFAFLDLCEVYKSPIETWAAIATRGASNSHHVPDGVRKEGCTTLLLMQNDGANQEWWMNLPDSVRAVGRLIHPPKGIKDLNDWIRTAGHDVVKNALLQSNP